MASLALEEEAMLQAALDASIADVQGTARHILSQPSAQHTTFREDLSSPASWPKELASGPASRGVVEQIGIVNQFSEAFRKTIDDFGKWQSDLTQSSFNSLDTFQRLQARYAATCRVRPLWKSGPTSAKTWYAREEQDALTLWPRWKNSPRGFGTLRQWTGVCAMLWHSSATRG